MVDIHHAGTEDHQDTTEALFFRGKRPWSKIKDQVLRSYIHPYLAKVAKLNKRIILIDAFAGPGRFDDGEAGSPLIFCEAAERIISGRYLAIFVNRDADLHGRLSEVVRNYVDRKLALPILGTAESLLSELRQILTDQTVFLYLDPFGLKGCEFSTIEPFLRRDKRFSTEIVINLSIPIMHRLAARKAVAEGRSDSRTIKSFHERLSRVMGGDYWQSIMWEEGKDPESKVEEVMSQYRAKLAQLGLSYTGSCPVREKDGSGIKYYITFCSRHPDALLLMNDVMCSAYQQRMHEAAVEGTLFANSHWKEARPAPTDLAQIVCDMLRESPGKSRADLWLEIVTNYFMRYTASEYKSAVADLHEKGTVIFKDIKGTRRLNDQAILSLAAVHVRNAPK